VSLVAAAVAGGALGARHALETDHLAAVATLVDPRASGGVAARPSLVGASWGVGHTAPIAVLGFALLLFGVRLPASVVGLFEAAVGAVLLSLGARMLAGAVRHHEPRPLHGHVDVGRLSLGGGHAHLHGDSALVGALHGVAGSGALVVALVSTAPDFPTAAAFLAAFGVCSILTMTAVSTLWGRTLGTGLERALRGFAGALGIGVGCLLLAEVAGLVG